MNNKELLLPNIIPTNTHRRNNELIQNKEVVIGAGNGADSFQGTRFENCLIRLRGSAMRTLHSTQSCQFEHCFIWAHRKQVGASWRAHFKYSIFKGRFELRFQYPLQDCDFSQAWLSHVFFEAHSDHSELMGLRYPHIFILDIQHNFEQWNAVDKPADYEDMVWQYKNRASGILVLDLTDCTEQPDLLWDSIRHLPFVISTESPS